MTDRIRIEETTMSTPYTHRNAPPGALRHAQALSGMEGVVRTPVQIAEVLRHLVNRVQDLGELAGEEDLVRGGDRLTQGQVEDVSLSLAWWLRGESAAAPSWTCYPQHLYVDHPDLGDLGHHMEEIVLWAYQFAAPADAN